MPARNDATLAFTFTFRKKKVVYKKECSRQFLSTEAFADPRFRNAAKIVLLPEKSGDEARVLLILNSFKAASQIVAAAKNGDGLWISGVISDVTTTPQKLPYLRARIPEGNTRSRKFWRVGEVSVVPRG